jgi:hypothetical protein
MFKNEIVVHKKIYDAPKKKRKKKVTTFKLIMASVKGKKKTPTN